MMEKWTFIHGSAGCQMARPSSAIAINAPAIGVHKPISNRIAAPEASTSNGTGDDDETVSNPAYTRGAEAAVRKIARPAPGKPPGKVEKSLCTIRPN